jgi:hypothetical protein
LETLQPEGKRLLSVAEFLRGYAVHPGQHFVNEASRRVAADGSSSTA